MSVENIRRSWQDYTDAWSDISVTKRAELLKSGVSDEIEFSNPLISGHSHSELIDAMVHFQEQFPGAHFVPSSCIVHHDQLLSAWTLYGKDGAELLVGHNYARADREGKIIQTAGFFTT